jgi:hypothetical protein
LIRGGLALGRDPSCAVCRSVLLDPFLNVVRALAGSELDDPKVGEAVLAKRIFLDDGFDLPSADADGQDDPAISRYLSTRDEKIAGSVVLLQENDVRGHVRVDFGEVGLVGKFDDEHGPLSLHQTHRGVKGEEYGILRISRARSVRRTDKEIGLVGALPRELAAWIDMSTAVSARSTQADESLAFIRYITRPEVTSLWKAKGLNRF